MDASKFAFRSVLIVDDDPIVRAIVEDSFADHSVGAIHAAGDGREALEILDRETAIDFIFCDLNMPNMDGLQFLRHVADRRFQGEIGIVSGEDQSIIHSAKTMAGRYGLKIRGAIKKPVDRTKINTMLAAANPPRIPELEAKGPEFTRNDLVFALVNRNIKTHFQPKVFTRTGELAGAEALARWDHPSLGLIPPSAFIPMAEEEGLIHAITGAIIRDTITSLATWSQTFPDMKMALNLSGDMLGDVDLPDHLLKVCRENGVKPEQIVLEITESRVLSASGVPIEILARLRMNRFELSIDDFGTGYSNIDRLREFPFTELKIDQSFIRNAGTDAFAEKCVRASVDLGLALGLRLVAEGVETAEDLAFVKALYIDQSQGFYFSKPLTFEAFTEKYFGQKAEVA